MDLSADRAQWPEAAAVARPALEARPPISLFGVLLDNVTVAEAIAAIERMVASQRPHYVVTANADFLVQATRDSELRRILQDADLALCDGTPVLWAARLFGNRLPERVAGSDLVPRLLQVASGKGYRVYFLGAAADRLERAVARVRTSYPGLVVAGAYSPPFAPLLEMDHAEMVRRVREARPDLLFVCFGCPKQEKWIAMHYAQLGVPVCLGVGGTIDFLSGELKRAPLWMRRTGTEWCYRLLQEPRRLFCRYANDLWRFGAGVLFQCGVLSLQRVAPRVAQPPPKPMTNQLAYAELPEGVLHVRCPDRLDARTLQESAEVAAAALGSAAHCAFDLGKTTFIDSTGVGFLIRLRKALGSAGRVLVLVDPPGSVLRTLRLMRVRDLFELATSMRDALDLIRAQTDAAPFRVSLQVAASGLALRWAGEVTAPYAQRIWDQTRLFLDQMPGATWTLDLRQVRFFDSSGLALLIRLRKDVAQAGGRLTVRNPSPPVVNVARISGMSEFLSPPMENDPEPRTAFAS